MNISVECTSEEMQTAMEHVFDFVSDVNRPKTSIDRDNPPWVSNLPKL